METIYKNIDNLELWRWNAILKSEQDGNLDLRYLIDCKDINEIKYIDNDKLNEIYINILSEFPNADTELIRFYTICKLYITQLRIELTKREYENKTDSDNITINKLHEEFSESFKKYINILDSIFTNYDIIEYYFDNLPIEFECLKGIKFYTEYEKTLIFDYFKLPKFCYTELFKKNYIKEQNIKISKIKTIDDYMLIFFKKMNAYELYPFIRQSFFDYQMLNCEKIKKENNNFVNELMLLQKITGVNLSLQNSVLSEYFALLKLATELNENNKQQ